MLSLRQHFKKSVRSLNARDAYDLWAPTYDDKSSNPLILIEEKLLAPFFQELDFREKRVIDLGCGTGRYFDQYILSGAEEIVGVDISMSMLEKAKRRFAGASVTLIEASVSQIPFHDAVFDLGISTLTTGYLADLHSAIAEMTRVLRPGGTLFLADLHPKHETLGWKRNFTVQSDDGSPRTYEIDSCTHSIAEYRRALENNNLEITSMAEPVIDSTVADVFEQFEAMQSYRKYFGEPILLTFTARKH